MIYFAYRKLMNRQNKMPQLNFCALIAQNLPLINCPRLVKMAIFQLR